MLFTDDLFTPRLRLVAITPTLLRLANTELSTMLAVDVPKAWPPEHWEPHVLDLIETQLHKDPQTAGWSRILVLQEERPVAVGVLGGYAKMATEVEVGYSLLTPWHGQGLATEALTEQVAAIFRDGPGTQVIAAHTFPEMIASVRVLEKCGFREAGAGEEPGTVRYELRRAR